MEEKTKGDLAMQKLFIYQIDRKYQYYNELVKKNSQLKEEVKFINNYKNKLITETGYLEKGIETFKEESYLRKNSRPLNTEFNIGKTLSLDYQLEELEQEYSQLKLKIAEAKENMDNANDDQVGFQTMNNHLKNQLTILEKDFEDLQKEKYYLKSLLKK